MILLSMHLLLDKYIAIGAPHTVVYNTTIKVGQVYVYSYTNSAPPTTTPTSSPSTTSASSSNSNNNSSSSSGLTISGVQSIIPSVYNTDMHFGNSIAITDGITNMIDLIHNIYNNQYEH